MRHPVPNESVAIEPRATVGRCGGISRIIEPLEHPVGVRCFFGDDLQHVPVLHDLSIFREAENVHSGVVVFAGPMLEAM
jgi:hypothetical protein